MPWFAVQHDARNHLQGTLYLVLSECQMVVRYYSSLRVPRLRGIAEVINNIAAHHMMTSTGAPVSAVNENSPVLEHKSHTKFHGSFATVEKMGRRSRMAADRNPDGVVQKNATASDNPVSHWRPGARHPGASREGYLSSNLYIRTKASDPGGAHNNTSGPLPWTESY